MRKNTHNMEIESINSVLIVVGNRQIPNRGVRLSEQVNLQLSGKQATVSSLI